MKYTTPFHILTEKFGVKNIPFLLIGDYARYPYDRRVRVTSSIEILIPENFLSQSLTLLGQEEWYRVFVGKNFVRLRSNLPPFLIQ